MKLSIIIPCFNEEENIPLILKRFSDIMQDRHNEMELILVDNGSTDNTTMVLKSLLPKYSFATTLKIPVNQGYGFGIVSGLKKAKGDFLAYTHADLQTDPLDVIKAYDIIIQQNQQTYIKGRRKNRPLIDRLFTIGMSIFETCLLKTRLWDINAQPNMFHSSFFYEIQNECPKDFSLDLYLLYMAKKKHLNIIRFDVNFPKRIHGESKWNTGLKSKWKFITRTIQYSIKLKKGI